MPTARLPSASPDAADAGPADRAEAALERVTAALGERAETRAGQITMARAVADALEQGHHLVARAGTGTGKTFAYLVPAVLSGQRVVVATATKTLQDQLAQRDLPFLQTHLAPLLDGPLRFAVLKGRSNYLCRQRADEAADDRQLVLEGITTRSLTDEVRSLVTWGRDTSTGDREELGEEPSATAWAAVSVGADECPGATRCPRGGDCFTEQARRAAREADVIVVNTHLYGMHLASGGVVLPEHAVVVFDEAHQLEDVVSATAGRELSGRSFRRAAQVVAAVVDDRSATDDLAAAGDRVDAALRDWVGRRLRGGAREDLADALVLGRARLDRCSDALRQVGTAIDDRRAAGDDGRSVLDDASARRERALQMSGVLAETIDAVLQIPASQVAWVELTGRSQQPVLRVAPLEVAPLLTAGLWSDVTAILTSATIPDVLPQQLGLDAADYTEIDAGSPFDFSSQALLYCAADLPDPRQPDYEPAMHDELEALIHAAGGRTLALFTSRRAMERAIEVLRPRLRHPVVGQDELGRQELLERFAHEEELSLFATMGLWQGLDVAGPSLSLVAIDKLPFPRPDEPLLQARREQARQDAFRLIDLPRAATLLAQGVGRLIRSTGDRGVVAVLDRRLATQRQYRWEIVNALPPMRRTRDRAEAVAFLQEIASPPASSV